MRRALTLATLIVVVALACRSRPADLNTPPASTTTTVQPLQSANAGPPCIDSDLNALDPRYVRGIVTVTDAAGRATTIPDACESERYVREGRCPDEPTAVDAQLGYYFLAYCANGCRDGACVQ